MKKFSTFRTIIKKTFSAFGIRAGVSVFCLGMALQAFGQGAALPYNTGFDNAAQQAGWQQYRLGNDADAFGWSVGGGGASAPNCVSHDYNVGANPTDTVIDWYISKPLNFHSTATMVLKVRTAGFSTPFPDSFEVLFGSTVKNPGTGNYVVIANLSNMLPQYQWLDTIIDIPFTDDSGYIALKYKTIGAAWSTYAFDDISIIADSAIPSGMMETLEYRMDAYPNPFSETILLQLNKPINEGSIAFYNVAGQLIKEISNFRHTEITISRDGFPAGIYFVRLSVNGLPAGTRKIIVTD